MSEASKYFDPYDPEVLEDPYPHFARFRAADPVHYNAEMDFWFAFRHADVLSALREPQVFSSERWLFLDQNPDLFAPNMQLTDPPRHDGLRRLALDTFTRSRVRKLEPRVREIARDLVDTFRERGEADFSEELAWPFPATVICELLGVPREDQALFGDWSHALAQGIEPGKSGGAAAIRSIHGYFDGLVKKRRDNPQDDLISDMIGARLPDGEALSHQDLVGFCFLILVAGHETTTHLLGNSLALLAERPDLRKRLSTDPSVYPTATEELLRWVTPAQGLSRTTTRPVVLGGKELPEGARVHLLFASANRDPEIFDAPDEVDLDRNPNPHLAFGYGVHFCLGAKLARLEIQVALEELLGAIPNFELTVDRVPRLAQPLIRSLERVPMRFQL